MTSNSNAYFYNGEFTRNSAEGWDIWFGSLFLFFWILFIALSISVSKGTKVGESTQSTRKSKSTGRNSEAGSITSEI